LLYEMRELLMTTYEGLSFNSPTINQ
jgi:hypothetical protein